MPDIANMGVILKTVMLRALLTFFVAIFQQKEADSSLLVQPEDVIVEPGQSASFNCSINTNEGIRWMYATKNNSQAQDHIYTGGFTYVQWRKRHIVTERNTGFFTLTIDPVIPNDAGYYTCMDIQDDSIHEAKLTVAAGTSEATDKSTASFYPSVTYSETSISEDISDISQSPHNESTTILTYYYYVIGSSCAAGVSFLILFLVLSIVCIKHRRRHNFDSHSVLMKSGSVRQRERETNCQEDGDIVRYQQVLHLNNAQRTATENICSTQYAPLSLDRYAYENPYIGLTQNATDCVDRQHPVYEEMPEPETNTYMEIAHVACS